MGIDNGAALVIGVHRKDLPPEGDEWLDNGDIDVFAPYYDGTGEPDAVCGVVVVETDWNKVIDIAEFGEAIKKASAEFSNVTGMVGRMYLTLNIS